MSEDLARHEAALRESPTAFCQLDCCLMGVIAEAFAGRVI